MTALFLLTVVPAYIVSRATSYQELLGCVVLNVLAGNAFSAGIAWNAVWFPIERQGFALGVFGAGTVDASVTKLFDPAIIAAVFTVGPAGLLLGGWRLGPVLYSGLRLLMAEAVWFLAPASDRRPGREKSLAGMAAPARRHAVVWELSLYYVVVFGAYAALSAVLPKY